MYTMEDLERFTPSTKLLYVTPEQCQTSSFRNVVFSLHQRKRLSLIAVDEVIINIFFLVLLFFLLLF